MQARIMKMENTHPECLQVRDCGTPWLSWVLHLFHPRHASLERKGSAMTYELRVCFGTVGDVELAISGWRV
jgi:hypothetical protein